MNFFWGGGEFEVIYLCVYLWGVRDVSVYLLGHNVVALLDVYFV